ncbi:MAG TPA: aldehyde dehydrogenase, partial [Candidatus Sulfotelmatobacter sp.]|nr:aldehyde dehydrogenase [Candidatus Sulfotelmatobacter sp.]
MRTYRLLIGGRFLDAASGKSFEDVNPATGEVLAQVAEAGPEDVASAVAAARTAFEGPWARMSGGERGKILLRIAEELEREADAIARLETQDNGRPIRETSAQSEIVSRWYRYFAGWADKIEGETIPVEGPFLNYTVRVPLGVVGQITPWNHPLLIATKKVAPALAAGNTIVLKPSELAPLSVLEFGRICQEAGLPDGVLNVLPGFPAAGQAICEHPGVVKIDVTGSTATGQAVSRLGAGTLKRISCELGGKAANIVLPDADLHAAVSGSLFAAFIAQGQTCIQGARLFVHADIHDAFLERFLAKARAIRVGDPLRPETQMGPQISRSQLEKIHRYVEIGVAEGAKLALGGRYPDDPALRRGFYYTPTVFHGVRNTMRLAQEEIFGPVVAVIRFDDEAEAIREANAIPFGLGAAVWTRDIHQAHRVAQALQAGVVWINDYHRIDPASPWGGFKLSGIGRENGLEAIRQYTEVKSIWVNLDERPNRWYEPDA